MPCLGRTRQLWRPSAAQGLSEAEQQIQQFTRVIRYQRAFPVRIGSHYIRVRTLGAPY